MNTIAAQVFEKHGIKPNESIMFIGYEIRNTGADGLVTTTKTRRR